MSGILHLLETKHGHVKTMAWLIEKILDLLPEEDEEQDGANVDLNSQRNVLSIVVKISTCQTIFLPVPGLVDPTELKPSDLEVDEKPTEDYNDIGGLELQIQGLKEAIFLPITHADRFKKIGIRPPKVVLLYRPPRTGMTLMARACAAETNATFLKLAVYFIVTYFMEDIADVYRPLRKLIIPMFWTLLSCDQSVWIVKLSSLMLLKKREPDSLVDI
ncbi:26S proteasome regulatory subunit 6A homolog [Papaver somniferum]|uniref:26S proteasome regulatory subunit 6A homolog n=1 Tax=Papaver somniferum TaxID=3469 RepID=UPI000E6F64E5|nr:26S proteasome regulatory subunit 6A homolog [Papaver somniferum]